MTTLIQESMTNLQSGSDVGHSARARVHRGLVTAAVACALSFGLVPNIGAAKLACKPDLYVKNEKSRAIKVIAFEYKVEEKNQEGEMEKKDYREGLANKKLAPGETEDWPSQKLQNVAEFNPVLAIRVEYRNDTSGEKKRSDPWGPKYWSKWRYFRIGDCENGRDYEVTVYEADQ